MIQKAPLPEVLFFLISEGIAPKKNGEE